ncbi:MAG: hypothetical protein K0S85_3117, partial [Pseudomonas orientalis]|nr:hypothetical protein [Pseudomonas orientalis]
MGAHEDTRVLFATALRRLYYVCLFESYRWRAPRQPHPPIRPTGLLIHPQPKLRQHRQQVIEDI